MKISVFGLGYVGCITAACLANEGHQVIGVDVNTAKVQSIQAGNSPIAEPGLARMIAENGAANRLMATTDAAEAVSSTDISLICVGTPSRSNGSLDTEFVWRVCAQIGQALAQKDTYHVVAMRSTILPDALSQCTAVLHQNSNKTIGDEIGFVTNPEFLREGSAIYDFYHPPLTLIGRSEMRAGDTVAGLYQDLPAAIVCTEPETAVMVKYACNAFHALKIVFANEMGNLCKKLGIDGQEMMGIFCQDQKLNLSSAYLRPGFAFGGSCLPKDLRALLYLARHEDVDLPVMNAILPSNQAQIQAALDLIVNGDQQKIGLVGLSFKPDTDDLRESPMVQLAETLLGKGYDLKIFDEHINIGQLMGSNRAFIDQTIPHLSCLLCDSLDELLAESEIVVVAHSQQDGAIDALANLSPEHKLIDLVRAVPDRLRPYQYEGICW